MPILTHSTEWWPWDVRSGASGMQMTPGTREQMARGVDKTPAATLDQQSGGKGSAKNPTKLNSRLLTPIAWGKRSHLWFLMLDLAKN